MVYPVIHINECGENSLALIDTNFNQNPILEIADNTSDIFEAFFPMLYALINQKNDAYDEGYDQAMLDMMDDYDEIE